MTEYTNGDHHEPPRSSHWPKIEKSHLAAFPRCACCSPDEAPAAKHQVHHRLPFHYCIALGRPDLETDERNLITLCETTHGDPAPNHHLLIGHLGNFKSDNVHVGDDATLFMGLTAEQIQADPRWMARKATRLKLLTDMSDEEKADFRALMDAMFPLLEKVDA